MTSTKAHSIIRTSFKVIACAVLCIVLLPATLYIPFVQNFVKNIATEQASKATGWNISLSRLTLRFPLAVSLDSLMVCPAENDTLLSASNLTVNLQIIPLLDNCVAVDYAELKDGKFNLTTDDESLVMHVDVSNCRFDAAAVDLKNNHIDAVRAALSGGDVFLSYDSEKSVEKQDTTKSSPWRIKASELSLSNVHYTMNLLPYIQLLDAKIYSAKLKNGLVDTGENKVDVRYLALDSVDCRYFTPSAEYLASHPSKPDSISTDTDTGESAPWTIIGNTIRLSNSHAIYAVSGYKPQKGLDMNYIECSDINIAVDSFYCRGSELSVPIRNIQLAERCGIRVKQTVGAFNMDSVKMAVSNLSLITEQSQVKGSVNVTNNFFNDPNKGKVYADAVVDISMHELDLIYPAFRNLLPGIPCSRMKADLLAEGSMKDINIKRCDINAPGLALLSAKGRVSNPTEPKKLNCDIDLDGSIGNLNFLKPVIFSDASTRQAVNFPPLKLKGNLKARQGEYTGDIYMATNKGDIVLDAAWNGRSTDYSLDFNAATLPLEQILPTSKLQLLSAQGSVKGHGTDIFDSSTNIKAEVSVDSLIFNGNRYYGMMLNGELANGDFNATFASSNPDWDLSAVSNGHISRDHYTFSLNANVNDLDLKSLNFMSTTSEGGFDIDMFGDVDLKNGIYDGVAKISNLRWTQAENYYYTDLAEIGLSSDSTHVTAQVINGDMEVDLNAYCRLDTLLSRFSKCSEIAMAQFNRKSLNIDTLQRTLPPFSCDMVIGDSNLAQQALSASGIKFGNFDCKIANDSTIYMHGTVDQFEMGNLKLDTIGIHVLEKNERIAYNLHVGNREGTLPGVATANLGGYVRGDSIEALFSQTDFKNQQGFNIGCRAQLSDTAVQVSLFPKNPVIAYKDWELNEHNSVYFNYKTRHFDADLLLKQQSSIISLNTQHNETEEGTHHDQEDIILKIADLQIADWLSFSPFAPPLSGTLSSDMKIKYDGKKIWGDGDISLNKVVYNKRSVGDLTLSTLIDLDPVTGGTTATANLTVNDRKCAVAFGTLNDSISGTPFLLELELDKFPLTIANPFLPKNAALITGNLDGLMKVSGSLTKPILDGYIQCDSATTFSMPIFGTTISLPPDKLPVDSSIIKLDNYAIKGVNGNPVTLNGIINAQDIDNPYLSLDVRGRDVQFINAEQTRKSQVFGRGSLNIDSSIRGFMDNLSVNAGISLLAGSNITYVMQTDVSTIAEQHEQKVVKFVQFSDSSYVLADSLASVKAGSNISLNLALNLQTGTTLSVFLSKNGSNRAEIHGNGDLLFSINRLGDQSLTGQYNIESGFVRYSPPLISRKNFTFNSGSYIRWSGELMNPHLNLSAYELHKTNVTQEDEDSRIVNFKIGMTVTNTLSDMNVAFDLSTDEDVAVQSELENMSAAQRSSQAVNLLLYNKYIGTDTKASGSFSVNPLFSFLTSKINNWAASTIKGISVTVGVDKYSQTQDGISTNQFKYSYQVSKSLFDDRFKIVVGGNYSPSSTSSQEIAKELFNDVSLEYLLNKSGNIYVRIFNHSGYANMLEGKITQTGVAFVYKRKISSLKHLFVFDMIKQLSGKMNRQKESNDSSAVETKQPVAVKKDDNNNEN